MTTMSPIGADCRRGCVLVLSNVLAPSCRKHMMQGKERTLEVLHLHQLPNRNASSLPHLATNDGKPNRFAILAEIAP